MIQYSVTPGNNNRSSDTVLFQGWAPGPSPYIHVVPFYRNCNYEIPEETIHFLIMDAINVPSWAAFPTKRLVGAQSYGTNNPMHWLTEECFRDQGYPNDFNGIFLTTTGLNYDFTPVYQNLELLPVGIYTFVHVFIIQGFSSTGWVNLSVYNHYIRFEVSNSPVQFTPQNFIMSHTIGDPMPTQVINMQGLNWKVAARPDFVLSSADLSLNIETVTDASGMYQTISGSGTKSFTVTLGNFFDTPGVFPPNLLAHAFKVLSGVEHVGNIFITLNIFQAAGITVTPQVLNFRSVRSVYDALPQIVVLSSSAPVILNSPPWIIAALGTILQNGITQDVITICPIPSINMALGTYTGIVSATATISGVPVTKDISINYVIEDMISSPYFPGEKAFTLDAKYFQLSSSAPDSYLQVDAEITTYDFFTDVATTRVISQKFVMFKNQQKFHLGETIHRLMNRFPAVNESVIQYKPALLRVKCTEMLYSDNTSTRFVNLPDISFVAGLSMNVQDIGFLDINPGANRVTRNSFAYISMLIPQGNYLLTVSRNGDAPNFLALPYSTDKIFTQKVVFEDYNQGDVIEFGIANNHQVGVQPSLKKYIVYPLGEFSNHIVWENTFLVQTALECTGSFKIQTEIEFYSQNLYQNLVEVLEHLDTNASLKFTINSGWLLKSDIPTIISLMKSRKAWLIKDNQRIAIRPIGKSIVSEDSNRELIEYSFEFQINQSHAEETYSL
jgi:hypothetical protein